MSRIIYEIVANINDIHPDREKVERIINRLIRPEFDSFGWSIGVSEWTWDFVLETEAQELMVILGRVTGLQVVLHVHDGIEAAAA